MPRWIPAVVYPRVGGGRNDGVAVLQRFQPALSVYQKCRLLFTIYQTPLYWLAWFYKCPFAVGLSYIFYRLANRTATRRTLCGMCDIVWRFSCSYGVPCNQHVHRPNFCPNTSVLVRLFARLLYPNTYC